MSPRAGRLYSQVRPLALERLEPRLMLSLTHLYDFNDGTADDSAGAAHGTLMNGATVAGGKLLLFNSATSGQAATLQYVNLPAGVLPTDGAATVVAWYSARDVANWSRVFDFGDQAAGNGSAYLFFTPQSSANSSRAALKSTSQTEVAANGATTDNSVQHMVAVVVDAAADSLRLYLDGVQVGAAPLAGADVGDVGQTLAYLGRSLFNADPGFTGWIDEVRIYDEALAPETIAADAAVGPTPADVAQRQMEYLDRGMVAVRSSTSQAYIGWRMLGTDPDTIAFNLYRSAGGGAPVKLNLAPLTQTTDFLDTTANFTVANTYFVRPITAGVELAPSDPFTLAANAPVQQYLNIPLQRPAGGTATLPPGTQTPPSGTLNYTYTPNDASVGDLDGDGQYEIVLKWDPTNAQDNSLEGLTGNVLVDAYKFDGTLMWRIDLGRNIRAGAHYTQFLVYDFDGDGRSEVVMKTADGTIDGAGQVIGNAAADFRDGYSGTGDGRWGRVLSGPEFLTVFDGLTGAALSTIPFSPPRDSVTSWGDNYGNRVDRFLATVAYLDGVRPSIVMARGYYAKTRLTAFDWRDGQLTERWAFDSTAAGNGAYGGQGNHNLSVADVDFDGKDEIVYGAAVFDDDGTGLHTTGFGHGDAMHVSDMDPARPGLEVWQIHEASGVPGADLRNAATGQALFVTTINSGEGPGRGVAADVLAASPGYEMWGAGGGLRNTAGANVGRTPSTTNHLVWWDADPVRELLDGQSSGNGAPRIDKYGTSADTRLLTMTGAGTNNGTKANPSLSGDILGDWREEVIVRSTDNMSLRVYTATTSSTHRLYTLMHDSQYRSAIAWQNVAYNQPPHPGFFLGAGMAPPPTPNIYLASATPPVVGDFDQDGDADDGDLAIWQQTFGTQDPSALPGDADGNRIVDGFDFLAWQQNLGAPALPAFAAASAAATAARSVVTPSHHDAVLTNLAAESARTLLFPDATPSAQGSTKAEVETPHTAFAASTISDQPAPQITETARPKRTRQAQGSSLDAAIDAVLQRAGVDDWRAWRSRL